MWGMPITVAIVEAASDPLFCSRLEGELKNFENWLEPEKHRAFNKATDLISQVFNYFEYIDNKFSTYKPNSEISLINQGSLSLADASSDMQLVFALAEKWRLETDGYFNISAGRQDRSSGAG